MKTVFQFLWRAKVYTIIVLIILAIIGISIYKKATSQPKLEFDKITRQTVVDTVSESGNMIVEGQANISSPAEGIIDKIYVENGDSVYAGQTLFSAKSTATEQQKATALSSYLSAQSNTLLASQNKGIYSAGVETAKKTLFDAQVNYNNIVRWYSLRSRNALTGRRYTQTEVDSAAASLKSAEESLAVAEQKLADADSSIEAAREAEIAAKLSYDNTNAFSVKAPSGGMVSNISIHPGDKVAPTATNSTLLVISRAKTLLFTAQINENEITKLKTDQNAIITIDAIKDKSFKALIKDIDSIGTSTAGVITFNVYFSLNETDDNMRSGMSGNAEIEVARHENVLTVANAAVKPYQNGKAVQIIDTTKPAKNNMPELKYIPIKTGLKGTERTEIIEGVSEGMEVIIVNTSNQFKSNLFGG